VLCLTLAAVVTSHFSGCQQVTTHVISSISHIGHEGESWPFDIEDHAGSLHHITLEPGQVIVH
jgi:uncharacterized protein YceK